MIAIGPRYNRLKTELQLAENRLNILEAKGKRKVYVQHKEIEEDLAKNRHIQAKQKILIVAREKASLEATELTKLYCKSLLSSMGRFRDSKKELDRNLDGIVSSLIWVTPFMKSDVPELKIISKELKAKCGKRHTNSAIENANGMVDKELIESVKFEVGPEDLTLEYARKVLRKYDIPQEKKMAFEMYVDKTSKVNGVVSKEEFRPNDKHISSITSGAIGKVESKAGNSLKYVASLVNFIRAKKSLKDENSTTDTQNDDAFGNRSTTDFPQIKPDDYISGYHKSSSNNSTDSVSSNFARSFNSSGRHHGDRFSASFCPEKCSFSDDSHVVVRRIEEQPDSSIVDLTGLNTLHVNGVCSNLSVSSTYNSSAESVTGTRGPPRVDDLPPSYEEIKFDNFVSQDDQFCNDCDNQNLYTPPRYLPSAAPSCPSDDDLYFEARELFSDKN